MTDLGLLFILAVVYDQFRRTYCQIDDLKARLLRVETRDGK